MATNNNSGSTVTSFAASQSAYLESLISYVLDVKPYHTKLAATGAVSEGYLFSDSFSVNISENDKLLILMGGDVLPSIAIPGVSRARISQSWWRSVVSNGTTSTWPLPQFSNPSFASSAGLQNFIAGTNDYSGIAGLSIGVFNPKRFDGPGITDVQRNGIHQQDTVDYTLCHGNYAVDILAGANYAERDIDGVSTFGANPGALRYNPVALTGGTITNITGGNYEEWTVTVTFTDGTEPAQASVVGSHSGNVGLATFNQEFASSEISFFWGPAPRQTLETAQLGASFTGSIYNNVLTVTAITVGNISTGQTVGGSGILSGTKIVAILSGTGGIGTYTVSVPQYVASMVMTTGDVWILTPSAKLTVAPSAPLETWSLIKSNPIALPIEPYFTPGPTARADTPTIEIHTRSLDNVVEESAWSIVFDGAGNYTLSQISVSNTHTQVISLLTGCSFKNNFIEFTLIPTVNGYNAGDMFSWTVGPNVANYKVYGSISGWQADAKLGQWYWNGLIGFKIPRLRYFVVTTAAATFTAIKPVHSIAEPSGYVVTFTKATNGTTPAKATVRSNLYGFRDGLIQGQAWSDEFCSFQLDSTKGFNVGDVVSVYLTGGDTYSASAAYEVLAYETTPYDSDNVNLTVPYLFNDEKFPLYENYGAVIWHRSSGTGTTIVHGDAVVIDKALYNRIYLQIVGSTVQHPDLGAINDWVPLALRNYDNVSVSSGVYTPTSKADFSDLATYIQAYSAADPTKLVFSILSPRQAKTNRVASSQLTFDPTFFNTYLPFNTAYSIQVSQDQSYGQRIRVKMAENLMIHAMIYLIFSDPLIINIIDEPIGFVDVITDIQYVDVLHAHFVEGGALPIFDGYDKFPYGIEHYDQGFPNGVIRGVTQTSPGVYQYTGSVTDYVIPNPTANPSISVSEEPTEITATTLHEGLIIEVLHTSNLAAVVVFNETFNFTTLQPVGWTAPTETTGLLISVSASSYVITAKNLRYDPSVHVPTFIFESTNALGVYDTLAPTLTFTPKAGATTASYTFALPNGLTVPFRLWIA